MRVLPEARSTSWWKITAISSLWIGLSLWAIRFGLLEQPLTVIHAFRYMLFAVLWSLLLGIAGWLGHKWPWLFAHIGILAGLVLMSLYAKDMTGWEDLASLLAFAIMIIAGFAAGIVVELLIMIIRLIRKGRSLRDD